MVKSLFILLDTEIFPLPSQTAKILEMFFHVREEIEKVLAPLSEKILGTASFIIVVIKPQKIAVEYIINDMELERLIQERLLEKMDLTKIASKIDFKYNN